MIATRTEGTKGMQIECTHRGWQRVTGAAEWKYQPAQWPLPICSGATWELHSLLHINYPWQHNR